MSETPTPRAGAGSVGGPGLLEADGEKSTLRFRRLLRHPIGDVWEAITDPAEVETWFMARVSREDAPGGRLEFEHLGGVRATGRVREWHPPRVYEYEWNVATAPNLPEGEASIVRWELTPVEGGTLLELTHRRLTRATARTFVRGLGDLLDRLSAHLDGRPLPFPPWLSPTGASVPRA